MKGGNMYQSSNKKTLLYTYAHIALPIIALCNPKKFYNDISKRSGKEYLESILQGVARKRNEHQIPPGLSLSKRNLNGNIELYLIQLPKPRIVPEAFYISTVFDINKKFLSKEVKSIRYFTLELGKNIMTDDAEYHLCEWIGCRIQGQRHKNFGRLKNSNKDTFVNAIKSLL